MKTLDGDQSDTTSLVSRLLDETLSPQERSRLELLIETDAAAREIYLALIDQEIQLSARFGSINGAPDSLAVPGVVKARTERRWPTPLALAATIAIATALWLWPRHSKPGSSPNPYAVPEEWAADFETREIAGWTGRISAEDLPRGSSFAIRSVQESRGGGAASIIGLPANWENGLFALTFRSSLQVTYRHALSHGDWLNIFIHTDAADPTSSDPAMYILKPQQFPGPAGTWQTASIPFSAFIRKVRNPLTGELTFSGGPPAAGERVFMMVFTGPPNVEFWIDRIAIVPNGPSIETLQSVP